MPESREYRRWLRLCLWLALLLGLALAAQSVVVAHQNRARGLPQSFPAPVAGADAPILGLNVALEQYDPEQGELDVALTRIGDAGFVWVRQSFYWSRIEPQPGNFDWSFPDRIMTALADHPKLRLIAVLEDDPPVPPADPGRFASFAAAFAIRYGMEVEVYQIWDEPNLASHWGDGPVSPPAYANLLAQSANSIRIVDPDARILLAGLAPTVETGPRNLSDLSYLEQLYQAGAAPYFDIVCGKPYGFYTGPHDRRVPENGSLLNFSRLLLLREVMVEHGDSDRAVWASHWGWNALPPDWTGGPSLWGQMDEATQAEYTIAALERARTEWPWVGAMILNHFQPLAPPDDPRWGFALMGPDDNPRPIYDAVADWAAALPQAAPVGGYPAHNPWAAYEGDWRVGPLAADVGSADDKASFRFDGTSVALTVRRGPYRAFLYVTVDGAPANALPRDEDGRAYLVLYDNEPSLTTVPLAAGLSPGTHLVEVAPERGQGQWALVDWRVGAEPVRDSFTWKMAGLAVAGLALVALLIHDGRRVEWGRLTHSFLLWPEWAQEALAVGLTGLLWVAAGVSWGRDWASPWLVVSLFLLPTLTALFALRPDLGLALVALTAPFYLHPGAMFYSALSLPEILVLLCAASSPALWIRKFRGLRITAIDCAVVLLLLAALSAGAVAADTRVALFELRAVFLIPGIYYALLRLTPLDERMRRRLVGAFVLGAVGMAAVGLAQYVMGSNLVLAEGGLPRLQSVYFSPNSAALYLERTWPLLLVGVVWHESVRRRLLYALALALVTLALLFSFSRGALLLALPASLLAMGWLAGSGSPAARRYRWAALLLVAIGASVLIPLLRLPRFASLLDLQQGSSFFRLELWRSSLALIRQHPWFGVGPGNFLEAYRTRYILPSAWQEFNLEHPHNIYLDHWTRLGLLGVLAGIAIQVAFFRTQIPNSRSPISLGLMGGVVALLAHGLVDNTLFFPDLALTFFLILALAAGHEYCSDLDTEDP